MSDTLPAVLLVVLALGGLVVTLYVHVRLPHHTTGRLQAELVRAMLIVTGLALGWTGMQWRPDMPPAIALLIFVVGFAVVHVPSAFILWSKRQRGVYR